MTTTPLTKQTFQASTEIRFFGTISISSIPILYWVWLLFHHPAPWNSLLIWLLGLGLIGLGWRGLAFLFQRISLTEAGLIIRQGRNRREVAYEDIFYVRPESDRFIGLTLVTAAGEIKIGRHIDSIANLTARLERQIPNLMTPRTRLPWRAPVNHRDRLILLGFVLLSGGMSLLMFIVGATGDGEPD